ncbi:hypothetical protein FQN60_013828 [Etheostoma spectabile]|uniref:Neurexin/syndecan/glycophorin C domain-containing protein n=1 Tax=Etheostoma spectabile TaxID=54343 RepID=A0A5J5CKM7_9PERO|nr:hypothetical protein FQN60_013828 [Etheostoma spectabile]
MSPGSRFSPAAVSEWGWDCTAVKERTEKERETLANVVPCQEIPIAQTGHIDPVLIERYNTPGFVGCLSRVQFNGVVPLKSALRTAAQAQATPTAGQPDRQPAAASPVSYQGKLVESNCGSSPLTIPPMSAATDPWHLDNTGVIAVVIFTILCTLVFLIRYMFRHKGTYHTNEAKGSGESAGESADTAIIGTDNPETIDESKKEWFI